MAKIIVLLADGTGNSAAKLFKTNVWRLYKALDQDESPAAGELRQIAYYHDGVGTSTFKPLAILGGVFGVGLKRNVMEIYRFLCRNYEAGDRIYAYGFSRGAFTIRVLAGVVAMQGVLHFGSEEELHRYSVDAYRAYRRRYKLPIFGRKDKTQRTNPGATVGLVDILRNLRDLSIRTWRRIQGNRQYDEILRDPTAHIADVPIDFIGVWDTVAAYGLPIDEMTRGIDEWVWPLSMPNYTLHPKVLRARHALSLDDERDTFHPLLWDEIAERSLVESGQVLEQRLQQVWFAGVHSNVGGGYADDSLSYVALQWMMDESRKPVPRPGPQGSVIEQPGLRFLPAAQWDHRGPPDSCGPLYNSRRGAALYYRYQPRKISARLQTPDPTTKMMQDPNRKGVGFLTSVQVHESVLERIRSGHDHYAPIVLPDRYEVVAADGTKTAHADPARSQRQEWVWNDVWRRRVNYFMTLFVTAVLVAFPLIQIWWPPSVCTGPQCLLTPVIQTAGAVLPGLLQPWIEAFAISPGWFLIVALIIAGLMWRGSYLKRSIQDGMRELWSQSLELPAVATPTTGAGKSPADLPRGSWDGAIWRLRSAGWYQNFFQWLKWRVLPGAFGALVLFGGALLILVLVLVGVQRGRIAYADWSGRTCPVGRDLPEASGDVPGLFDTASVCWPARVRVVQGRRYVITMRVTEDWVDKTIPTSPLGFESSRFAWYVRPAILLRRSLSGPWFGPIVQIRPARGSGRHAEVLDMRCACGQGAAGSQDSGKGIYRAEFVAGLSGEVFIYVNDLAAGLLTGPTNKYYDNNRGKAQVRIEPFRLDERTGSSAGSGNAATPGGSPR